jgi:mono/diheme cytochrome c family protein
VGWIYFVAAWMSLFVINGIITFQLSPGRWVQTQSFWDGIFNPTFWPSLVARTAICAILAGVFGLITLPKGEGRERVVRLAAQWIVGGSVLLPFGMQWYLAKLPQVSRAYLDGVLTGVQHAVRGGMLCALLTLVIALVFGWWRPRWMRPIVVTLLVIFSFGLMGSFEYLREYLRKPWAVNQVVYANDLRASQIGTAQAAGVSGSALYLMTSDTSSAAYGENLFQLQCASCHAVKGYRGMDRRTDGWDAEFAADILQHLPAMHGTMPPYAGNEEDRKALGRYLAGMNAPWQFTITDANRAEIGAKVFKARCGACHSINGKFRPLRGVFEKQTASQVKEMFPVLGSMSPNMPNFNAPDDQADALAFYISQEANRPLPPSSTPQPMPIGNTKSQMTIPAQPGPPQQATGVPGKPEVGLLGWNYGLAGPPALQEVR